FLRPIQSLQHGGQRTLQVEEDGKGSQNFHHSGDAGLVVQQEGERLRQNIHHSGTGRADDETEADGLVQAVFHQEILPAGGGLRDGGHEGDRQGVGDERREGDQRKGHSLQLTVQGRRRGRADSGQGQALGYDDGLHRIGKGAEQAAGRHRNGDAQKRVEGGFEPAEEGRPFPRDSAAKLENRPFGVLSVGADQHHQPGEFAADDAGHRAGGGVFDPVRKQNLGQDQHREDADDLFDELGKGVGAHALPSLKLSSKDGGDGDDRNDRRNPQKGIHRPLVRQQGIGDHRRQQNRQRG